LFKSFLNFIYPNTCLHCSKKLIKNYNFFCSVCVSTFLYLEPFEKSNFSAVFENNEVIATFIKEIKKQTLLGVAKIAAAFIVIQHDKLNWEKPNVIVPMTKNRFFKDHIYYLSKAVASFYKVPISTKCSENQVALVITDIMRVSKFKDIEKQLDYKKIYGLGLSFDIFFDHFNLS